MENFKEYFLIFVLILVILFLSIYEIWGFDPVVNKALATITKVFSVIGLSYISYSLGRNKGKSVIEKGNKK